MRHGLSGWRLVLVSGALWGVAVTLAETTTVPVADLSTSDTVLFALQATLPNMTAGLLWAWGAQLAEDRGAWVLVTLAPIATAASMLVTSGFATVEPQLTTHTGEFLRHVPIGDLAWYIAWTNLFYGYLYAAGYLAARRRLRGRAQLAVRRRERSEVDTALREAQLASLRGQLQPELLIEALQALQVRFARSQAEGDRLFDATVAFLRAAMPGVRLQASRLADELDTVRHYAALCEALGRTGIRLSLIDRYPGNLTFPSLLLLPLVHLLADQLSGSGAPEMTARVVGDRYQILLTANRSRTPIAAALDALDRGVATVGGSIVVTRGRERIRIAICFPLGTSEIASAYSLMSVP